MNTFLLIFAFIPQLLTQKDVWDGNNYNFKTKVSIKTQYSIRGIAPQEKEISKAKVLKEEIDVLPHLKFKNVYLCEFDVTGHKPRYQGYVMREIKPHGVKEYHIFSQGHKESDYFFVFEFQTCQIFHCELGIRFVHKRDVTSSILKNKIKDFIGAYYIKLVSADNALTLDEFTIKGNKYPLVACPHERWVGLYSALKFVPFDENGKHYNILSKRQIVLPIYQRSESSKRFKCGDIKYVDGTYLSIYYDLKFADTEYMDVGPLNIVKDKITCNPDDQTSEHVHFVYNDYKKNHRMTYVGHENLNKYKFHYKDLIYIYDEKQQHLARLLKHGITNHKKLDPVEPKCIKQLVFLPSSLKFIVNNKVYDFKEEVPESKGIKIFSVEDNMLDKMMSYSCSILVTGLEHSEQGRDYYEPKMGVELVYYDNLGNKKVIKYIKFTRKFEGFGIYTCSVGKGFVEDDNLKHIKEISFITMPIGSAFLNQEVKWLSVYSTLVECSNKFSNFATLILMNVTILGYKTYDTDKDNAIFSVTDHGTTRFKHDELIKNKISISNITYNCLYETALKTNFTVHFNGIILQKEVYSSGNTEAGTTIGAAIGILIFGIVFCIVCILVILKIKKDREKKRKKRKPGSSKSSESSDSTTSSTGMGDISGTSVLSVSPIVSPSKKTANMSIENIVRESKNVKKKR